MDRMRSFFHTTPSAPKTSVQPVFTSHRISPDLVRLMAAFLNFNSIQALSRANRTWRQMLCSNLRNLSLDCKDLHQKGTFGKAMIDIRNIFNSSCSPFLRTSPNLVVPPNHAWPLQDFTALQYLQVSHIGSDDSFSVIGRLTTLQTLIVYDCNITGSGLISLTSLTALKILILDRCQSQYLNYDDVAELKSLPLKTLLLGGFCRSWNHDARSLTCFTTLSKLIFIGCIISHAGELRHLMKLQNLSIQICQGITFNDLDQLNEGGLQSDEQNFKAYLSNFCLKANSLDQLRKVEFALAEWGQNKSPEPLLQFCDLYFVRRA